MIGYFFSIFSAFLKEKISAKNDQYKEFKL
ncbi:hypothetical protein EV144_101318 [Flavobacterium sp. 270]|nr:hypothetical protein EV144_101318 [Flavobacterium sp. 270]